MANHRRHSLNRSRILTCALLAFYSAVAVPGCTEHHPPSNDGTSIDEAEVRRAICTYLRRCQPRALLLYPGGDTTTCAGFNVGEVERVDPAACLEALGDDQCSWSLNKEGMQADGWFGGAGDGLSLSWPRDSPCVSVSFYEKSRRSAPARGERCVEGELSCQQDLYCKLDEPLRQGGNSWCGTCVAAIAAGQSCTAEQRCASGKCIEGICVRVREAGEACDTDQQCHFPPCDSGFCSHGDFTGPLTLDGTSKGARCDEASRNNCASDSSLACVSGICVTRADQGEPCDSHGDCRKSLGCDDGECAKPSPDGVQGEFCSGSCAQPLSCVRAYCQPLPKQGEPCAIEVLQRCGDGLFCVDEICHPPRGPGESCDGGFFGGGRCEAGLSCLRDDLVEHCAVTERGYVECEIPACDDCGTCAIDPGAAACQ